VERIALNHALRQALRALARFPLVFAAGVIGAVAALTLNHLPFGESDARAVAGNLAMTAWLGVPLLFALAAAAEARRLPTWAALGLQGLGAVGLIGYHHLLEASPWPVRISRFWLCMLAAHLLASLAAGFGKGASAESFWRYNQRLASRLGLSLGYCALMHLGLGLGLAAIKGLFELDFPDTWFLDPGIFALGVFNTWFFLAGVPRFDLKPAPRPASEGVSEAVPEAVSESDMKESGPEPAPAAIPGAAATTAVATTTAAASTAVDSDAGFHYPRQLRVLVQLILMPLVCVYLGIIYAYGISTLMQGHWPAGWVTWLLLSFCGMALLCLFLAQPLADRGGNRWVKLYCRHFHVALVPVLILLFAAIGKRVQEYGITENSYFALALGVWLSGIVLHAAVDAPRDLRLLPGSLCLAALMAAFGPWGAFEVSRKSQEQRLKALLDSHAMLVGGKLAKAPGRVPRLAIR